MPVDITNYYDCTIQWTMMIKEGEGAIGLIFRE